jgi:hypothetical protein
MNASSLDMMIWNMILTGILAVIGFMAKSKFDHVERIGNLLNKTREEIARDHITRAEYTRDLDKIMERFDAGILRVEAKIDELNRRNQKNG